MTKFISVLISQSHQRMVALLLWLMCFVVVLGCAGWFAVYQVADNMRVEGNVRLEDFARLRENLVSTSKALHTQMTAEPCTPLFHEQLRRVAYLPDGFNEFLYAPDGVARCSVNMDFAAPVALGTPDVAPTASFRTSIWLDRDLGFLGLDGMIGSIAGSGSFGIVIPQQNGAGATPPWMSQQVVLVAPDGRWWDRGGEPGLYARQLRAEAKGGIWPLTDGAFLSRDCEPVGLHCVVGEATLHNLFVFGWQIILGVAFLCALVATWVAGKLHALLRRYWAFEARFRRHFSADSVICAYQPIMNLSTGEIVGCEVLARWRDVDGTTVFPDQFLGIVEKHNLTLQLTRFVAERAHRELSAHTPPDRRMQVNFNIFPRDLDAAVLLDIFAVFVTGRFDLVIEIVECDALQIDAAQRAIETLRRAGIRVYLDDFGTGHSNIHHLVALSLDGVKLDRAFAMAADTSLMGQMLGNAIGLIHATGRVMVVEGVETEERLAMLKSTGLVDFVQGYLIARPLDIERYAQFLLRQMSETLEPPRLVA